MDIKKQLTVLVPCYNEEESLPLLLNKLREVAEGLPKYDFEFLLIDDGSRDKTAKVMKEERLKDKRVSYITLSRNYGKETAMSAGFDYAKGDAVIIIDADLQHPPELIGQMTELWEQGYDDVYAKRKNRKGESRLRIGLSKLYYKLMGKMTRYPIYPDVGDFRLIDRRCVEAIRKIRESQRNTKSIFAWIGYKKISVDYEVQPRAAGSSKWNPMALLNLAIDGITSFTTAPLRFSMLFGMLFLLISFVYMLTILVQTICYGADVAGYPSLMSVILFMGGVQLFSLGVISEYLGKVFSESKKRPLYFVDEYNDEKENNDK